MAVLIVFAAAAFGVFILLQGSSTSAALRGTTPSARRIAALIAKRTINQPGNHVSAASCRLAGYAGYRCAVVTNGGGYVCDANGWVDPPTPPAARRLTLLTCATQAHYNASEALTRSLARSSLDAINRNPRDSALLSQLATGSTSFSCQVYRLRAGRSMTRVIAVWLSAFVNRRQTRSVEWHVLPDRKITLNRRAGLDVPIASWTRCTLSPGQGIALQRTRDEPWPVEYAKEDSAAA
jgi:hypothetical protein